MASSDKLTDATMITGRLLDEIVRGIVPAGAKLNLVALSQGYQVGRGALREAACRLASEGLVVIEDQRGFRTMEVSRADLLDVTLQRRRIECLALRDAIAHGDDRWESKVVAAWHLLQRVSEHDASSEARREFAARHRAFHEALCEACPSAHLLRFRASLYTHSERYRYLALEQYQSRTASRDIAGEHDALVEAVLARDADLACSLLDAHIQSTADTLLAAGSPPFGEA